MTLRAAHVGSDVLLRDLQVKDGLTTEDLRVSLQHGFGTRNAIDATSSRIGGNVFFQSTPDVSGFEATGSVTFFGSEVTGSVMFGGSQFHATGPEAALVWSAATIGGVLNAQPEKRDERETKWTVNGRVEMFALSVKANVTLVGTVDSFSANRLTVLGDTTLALLVKTRFDLDGADLKGSLELAGFSFASPINPDAATAYEFSMRDADVGHTLSLADRSAATVLRLIECQRSVLRCHPGYHLFRIKTNDGIASILSRPRKRPILLDGISYHLHDLSRSGALDLSTPEAVRDYMRLFGAYVWGEEGAFAIIETASQLPTGSVKGMTEEQLKTMLALIELDRSFTEEDWLEIRRQTSTFFSPDLTDAEWNRYKAHFAEHGVRAATHVRYSNSLFRAQFVVLTTPFSGELRVEGPSRWMDRLHNRRKGNAVRRPYLYQVGYISMIGDESVAELDAARLPIYDRPLIRETSGATFVASGSNGYLSDYRSEETPENFSEVELSLRLPEWRELLETRLTRLQNAKVDLTNATCRTLDDADGRAWGPKITELKLENFVYGHIASPSTEDVGLSRAGRVLTWVYESRDRIPQRVLARVRPEFWFEQRSRAETADRINWLGKTPLKPFLPQPYAQLAGVLHLSGDTDGAKAIEKQKIDLEVEERSRLLLTGDLLEKLVWFFYRPLWAMFRLGFNYGLSPRRASLTVAICLLAGWFATTALDDRGYLVQNTSTSATLVAADASGRLGAAFPHATPPYEASDLPCGNVINKLLYATDVFIPLLDLRQESRCDVRSPHAGDPDPAAEWQMHAGSAKLTSYLRTVFHSPVLWVQLGKSLYAILGWVVISLTILTYSGTLRRWGEK